MQQIDNFVQKLQEHAKVVEVDSGSPARSSIVATVGSQDGQVERTIAALERRAINPREALLAALKKYRETPLPEDGDLKTRIAPHVLAKLYKSGRTAKQEMAEWRRSKQLERCQAAGETLILGMVLDRMLENGEDLVNSGSAELVCRRLYAILKAYERVNKLEDWQRPKNQSGQKWKSKVDWMLGDLYFKVGDDDTEIREADEEVQEKLKRKALFAKHLAGASEAGGATAED